MVAIVRMRPRVRLFEIFALALATILLEVSYTRIFSYKLVYFFTYVVIGLALLGLGSGGVVLALFRPERRRGPDRLLAILCAAAPASVLLGYLVVAGVQVNAFDMIRQAKDASDHPFLFEAGKLALVSAALFVPFFCAGLAISTILAADPAHVGRLYGADLLGAGLGCAVSVLLIDGVSPPGVVMLAAACFGLAGVRLAASVPTAVRAVGLVATGLALVLTVAPGRLPDVVVDNTKTMNPKDRPPVLFSRWSSVFRVDVMESPLFAHAGKALIHDGMWGSVIPQVDAADASFKERLESDPRALPFAVLGPSPTVTVIGSAGGTEILTALHFGARHVTGVELNPVTVGLLRGPFKTYTGNMADDPRVRLVNAEGRAYLAGTDDVSDLMWFVAPDSYAAMNAATSGAFVLSESYLYTAEMIQAALAHVGSDGVVCAQFGEIRYEQKPNRTTRYLTTAREAFRRLGIPDFPSHVMVATSPGFGFTTSTILLRRKPFAPADVERLTARAEATSMRVRFPSATTDADRPVRAAITLAPDELDAWYRTYPFDVRPVTDDRPFFWHFVSFRGAFRNTLFAGAVATEEGLGERLLVVLLGLVTAFAALALVVPVLVRRRLWASLPQKGMAMTYFAGLGLGFMLFELTLIQRLTLFLGYPTYSLSVTLCALLVSAGVGSLLSERLGSTGRPLAGLMAALVACVLALRMGLPLAIDAAGGASLAVRIAIALAFVVPLGTCLGTFMPLGLSAIAAGTEHRSEYVAWAWAVNGFFSVVASVLGTLVSMTWGFQTVLWVALAIYALAVVALRRLREPVHVVVPAAALAD